jgi:hypothetical protein
VKEAPGRHRLWQVAVVAAGLALIVLTWVGTYDAMRIEHAEAQAQVQAELANEGWSSKCN